MEVKTDGNGGVQGPAPGAQQQQQVNAHNVYNDISELDAIEKRTLESARVYLDPERTTPGNEVNESDEMHALRFETYDAICRSLVYHKRQVKVCEKGNIHQLVTLCMRNIIITPRTIFMNTCTLLKFTLRPNESVIDLINKIDGAQQDAIMMDNQAITEELKTGALLNAVADDNRFKSLAETFSLSTCNLDYREMCDELIKHELHRAPHTQHRQRQYAYQVTATGPQHAKGPAQQQVCNDFLKGKCMRGGNCNKLHTTYKPKASQRWKKLVNFIKEGTNQQTVITIIILHLNAITAER